MAKLLDISHHQQPEKINYDALAKEVDLVIIRTQYGSKTVDKHYQTHHAEFKKRGVPTNAYAWVRGVSNADMEVEATDFYNRTKDLNPEVWWLDVEERTMNDMRGGVSAYIRKLRELGARKVGVYIAHHLYKSFNLDLSEADAVWIPRYGTNNGEPQVKPDFSCDIWQYTSVGRLPGYDGNLDVNTIISDKPLEWFTGGSIKVEVVTEVKAVQEPKQKPQPVQTKPNMDSIVPYPGRVFYYEKGKPLMTGKDVERIQRASGMLESEVDGKFGKITDRYVRSYQSRHGLEVDGRVGPITWARMF